MFVQNVVISVLTAAMAVRAVPVYEAPSEDMHIVKRVDPLPNAPPVTAPKVVVGNLVLVPKNTKCGNNKYASGDVRDAIVRGQQYVDAHTVAYAGSTDPAQAANGYPHNLNNIFGLIPQLPQGCSGQTLEFPILTVNGNVRRVAAGPAPSKDMFGPGPDRVIFTYTAGILNYCGVLTHTGAPGNNFVVCTQS